MSEGNPTRPTNTDKAGQKIPGRGLYTEEARIQRLEFLRKECDAPLPGMNDFGLQADRLTGNIENLIGSIEVPVGIAGPLLINGEKAEGSFYLPMATSEGDLVASATRGATAISQSGGVTARVIRQQMLRVPLFVLSDMKEALLFADFVREHVTELQEQVRQVSNHAKLSQIVPFLIGNQVHVRFVYETGDAAGQNMSTTCTWHACQWLMKTMHERHHVCFENFLIEGNMSGDKKVNYQSFIAGRGTRVSAEAFIATEVLERVLKATPEQMVKCNQLGMVGACQTGMIGYNLNTANVIAAVFAATGQDIACVHESSVAQLHLQTVEGGLYASINLPALVVGTVGGGTGLPRQRQMLEMLGCAGPGKVSRFAEIIASFCLALDVSTLSAVCSGQFSGAHEQFGRHRPVEWFLAKDLSPEFMTPGLQEHFNDSSVVVESVENLENVGVDSSIITELTARKVDKFVGLPAQRLTYRSGNNSSLSGSLDVISKVKPLDKDVILMVNSMAAMCSPGLGEAHERFKDKTGLAGSHVRELALYKQTDPRIRRHMPTVYQAFQDDAREAYVVVMEQLKDVVLKDTADDPSGWSAEHVNAALEGIAKVHSVYYGRTEALANEPWMGHVPDTASMIEMSHLWEHLGVHAAEEFPEWITERDLELHRRLVRRIFKWWHEIELMPKTLIHNDFNPQNICLRPSTDPEDSFGYRLCAYDWELATVHLPQHDLAELLCFVLHPDVSKSVVDHHVEVHRAALEKASGQAIDAEEWRRGYNLALYDLAINRTMLYIMAHTFRHYPFMERVSQTLRHLVRLESGR